MVRDCYVQTKNLPDCKQRKTIESNLWTRMRENFAKLGTTGARVIVGGDSAGTKTFIIFLSVLLVVSIGSFFFLLHAFGGIHK